MVMDTTTLYSIITDKDNFQSVLKEEIVELTPLSKRIEVAGSIRRKKPNPHDIDLVIIPKNLDDLLTYVRKYQVGSIGIGKTHASYVKRGIGIQIFFATEDNFGAMLLTYTGPSNYNIGLRCIAKNMGMRLNQYGLYDEILPGCIASKTEEDIYIAIGKVWKEPESRGL
jgi:DNA polymerase (family X)